MNTLKSEKYISLDEAAEHLGIKHATLRSWLRDHQNEVSVHKIGHF